jgi:hypothetical protein
MGSAGVVLDVDPITTGCPTGTPPSGLEPGACDAAPCLVDVSSPETQTLEFHGVSPNPLRGPGQLSFSLPEESDVKLELLDQSGRRIATLARGRLPAGRHSIRWDGRRGTGALAPPGIYLARFESGGRVLTQRIVLLR